MASKMFEKAVKMVYEKLKEQGKPGMDVDCNCQLKTEDGLHCAIGFLIPEERYQYVYESYSIEQLREAVPELKQYSVQDLVDLMGCHDRAAEQFEIHKDQAYENDVEPPTYEDFIRDFRKNVEERLGIILEVGI